MESTQGIKLFWQQSGMPVMLKVPVVSDSWQQCGMPVAFKVLECRSVALTVWHASSTDNGMDSWQQWHASSTDNLAGGSGMPIVLTIGRVSDSWQQCGLPV
eukprot:365685-Amphidinium_carterae.1